MLSPATQQRRGTLLRSPCPKSSNGQAPSPALQAPAATPLRCGRSAENHGWHVRRTLVQPPLELPSHPTCRVSRSTECRVSREHDPNSRHYKFQCTPARWSKIDLDGLSYAGSVSDGEFQPHRVHRVHVLGPPFHEKGEVVQAERHGILKYPQPLCPFDRHTDVDVFGGACSLRKSEFKGDAAFQVVAVQGGCVT
jgi:hypothetical protein